MTIGPVRASRLPVARRCAPRGASRPFLGCTAWVRRTRFYNRLSLTCTRRKNTLSGACPPSAVGKPAGVPLRDPPRRGSSPSSAADAGPPRGHPASDGSVLDGTSPASGRGASRCARALRREVAGAFSAACRLAARALWRLFSNERENAGAFVSPTFDLGSAGRTSMPPAFARSRRLPPGKNRSSTLAGPALSAAPVGRRARLPHVFVEVRRLRLDHWRPALASPFLAACASTASADRCFNEHYPGSPEHPGPAELMAGTAAFCRSIVSFRSRQPPKVRRVRGRGSPILDAPSRDCSRERLRPNPDRFRHLVSRSLPAALPGVGSGGWRSRQRRAR